MTDKDYALAIIELKTKDDILRDRLIKNGSLWDGYHPDMRALHNENIHRLKGMMVSNGFPRISTVGKEAYEAAFFIVQHAIDHPTVIKKYAEDLWSEAQKGDALMIHYAYLIDRIAVFEGHPQIYGTQFDWDKFGQLSPMGEVNFKAVNTKRKELGLVPLEDQIVRMRAQAKKHGQTPPSDFEEKQARFHAWLKEVGWRT